MKKLLKKKVNVFGKTVPVLAIFILGIALVGAVLVDYLSNTVQTDVEVKLPMVVGMSLGKDSWSTTQCWKPDKGQMVDCFPEGAYENGTIIKDWDSSDWKETITLPVMYTGQENTFTIYLMSANVADRSITAHEEIRVENPEGITCADFEPMSCRFDSIYSDGGYGTQHTDCASTPECHNVNNNPNLIEIWLETDDSTWSGETDVSQWGITFKEGAFGTYTFTYRVIPLP
jgi:hypothetical protein